MAKRVEWLLEPEKTLAVFEYDERYAMKNLKSDHSFFTKVGTNLHTRQKSNIIKDYKCNFGRFEKSSFPYLAKLLNSSSKQ